jgi:hypothetical protein
MAVPPPVLPLPPPPQAFLTFADSPAPHDRWVPSMLADPLLEVAADDAFPALFQCWKWTAHPPPPAAPTHLRCPYSWVHLLLHSCLSSEEDALLDSPFLTRYDLPSKLAAIWLTLSPHVDQNSPFTSIAVAWKACLEAAFTCPASDELKLLLVDTAFSQAAPAAGPLASRWPVLMTSREVNQQPQVSLFSESWLLWRCKRRFTNAARSEPANPLFVLFESARAYVLEHSPLMAPFLTLDAANIPNISGPVASHMALWTLPVEMIRFPPTAFAELMDASRVHDYLFEGQDARQTAFVDRLTDVLAHFPELHSVLLLNEGQADFSARRQRLQQLVTAYFSSSQDAFSIPILHSLEARIQDVNAQMALEADPPLTPTACVLYHCAHLERLKRADKDLSKASAAPSSASKLVGVQTHEFRESSAALLALIAGGMADPNAVFQLTFKLHSKLLILQLLNLCTGVSGFPIFASLSPYKNHFAAYISWAFSTDDAGSTARKSKGRVLPDSVLTAITKGHWCRQLDLYNTCKVWEQMMVGREFQAVPEASWYMNSLHLQVMLKLGARLFNAIKRSGGDRHVTGSFAWVMKQGIDLLQDRTAHTCPPVEIDEMVAWWFRAALTEAGAAFADETKSDTDFSLPLQDVFLYDNGRGCITQLQTKLASMGRWENLADDLPHTIGRLMQSSEDTPANNSVALSGSLSTFLDPVVRAATAHQPAATLLQSPAPPQPPQNSSAQAISTLQTEVQRLTAQINNGAAASGASSGGQQAQGRGKGKGKGGRGNASNPTQQQHQQQQPVIGSDMHLVSYCDAAGVSHTDDALNVMMWVKFKTVTKKALRADLVKEFGAHVCFPPLCSSLLGRTRFTLCDNPSDPGHASASSPAHRYPHDYRKRMNRIFQ